MLSSEKPKNAEDDDVEMENQMPQKENSEESFNMFKKWFQSELAGLDPNLKDGHEQGKSILKLSLIGQQAFTFSGSLLRAAKVLNMMPKFKGWTSSQDPAEFIDQFQRVMTVYDITDEKRFFFS